MNIGADRQPRKGRGAQVVLDRLRSGPASLGFYALLGLLSFPTIENVLGGTAAPNYALDVFDADGGVPRIGVALHEIATTGLTLWEPGTATGLPTLGHAALTPIAPDVAIGLIAGPFAGYAVTAWLLAVVAGFGMHRFLRDSVHLPVIACLAGGVIYLFSFWHYVYGFAAPLAPLLLWYGDRLSAGPNRGRALVLGVAAVALASYAGLGQIAVLVGALHLAWATLGSSAGRLRHRLAAWAAIWSLGLTTYLPVLLTQAVNLPGSTRTLWDYAYLYDSRALPSLGARLSAYAATFLAQPVGGIGPSPGYYGTWFMGVAGLAALGAIAMRRPRRRAFRFALLAAVAIPVIDWAFIVAIPHLGSLGFLRSYQVVRIRHLYPFVLVLLAALGAARLVAAARSRSRRARVRGGALVALAAVAGAAEVAAAMVAVWHRGAIEPRVGHALVAAALLLGLAGLGGATAAVWLAVRRGQAGRWQLPAAVLVGLLLVLVLERSAFANGERLAGGQLGTWDDRVALTGAQRQILALDGPNPGRTLSLGDEPNRMGFAGIPQVDGYVAAYPARYHDLFGVMTASCLERDPGWRAYFNGWGSRFYAHCPQLDAPVADLLGVRWISATGATPAVPGLVLRWRAGDQALYQNPGEFPLAFLVGSATVAATELDAEAWLARADDASLRAAVVVVASDAHPALPDEPGEAGSATVVTDQPGRQVVDVSARRQATLVISDSFSPEWTATVDGQPAQIFAVDLALRGIAVGPGDHQVVVQYRPVATWAGMAAAAAAALVTAGLAILLGRRSARRTVP